MCLNFRLTVVCCFFPCTYLSLDSVKNSKTKSFSTIFAYDYEKTFFDVRERLVVIILTPRLSIHSLAAFTWIISFRFGLGWGLLLESYCFLSDQEVSLIASRIIFQLHEFFDITRASKYPVFKKLWRRVFLADSTWLTAFKLESNFYLLGTRD